MKHTRIFLLFVVLTTVLAACRNERVWRIGVSQCSADDWRSKMNEEIMSEELFHDNITIEIRSADDSNQKQIDDIRYFAQNGFDIIVASPNEAGALTPVIREVYESGIPVVLFDRNIDGDYYTAWQGADNVEIGRSAAKYAMRLAGGECRVIEIRGLDGSTPTIERHEGFLQEAAENGGGNFRILGSGAGDWNAQKGRLAADSLLALYPQTNIIYAHNDRMAIAAAEAAHDMGRDDIKIIGIDAAPEIGIRAVADGLLDATFLYPTDGYELIRTAIAILDGKPYERRRTLPTAPAVDSSNAEMILLQNKMLKEENERIEWLKAKVDGYLSQQASQRMALYSAAAVLLLFAGVIFLLLRAYWNHVRHRKHLDAKNRELEQQRNELNSLYQQVVEATQSRLAFFTSVSHDLRTPLTLIADPVEQMAAAENIDEHQRMMMRLADKNVRILKRLINQILDFRKYEHGKLTLDLAETEPAALVCEWGESFRHAALKKHIRLSVTTECPADFRMALDVEKFERIFFNLLSNAFKYTPENERITVLLSADDNNLTLTVSDTGQGIGSEDLEHIFDRFFRADKINPNGSGIGLTMVKAFAELHGGSVAAQSERGKGSVFTVTLPVVHVESSASDVAISESSVTAELADVESAVIGTTPDENSPAILIIDDNADIRTMVSGLLCDKYVVIQAANGLQGIKLASKYTPDLVICDVMMPDMDGMETCRRLKAEITTSHIPVLMLTACSMDEQRIEGYECGADAYLSKPFNSRVLLARCEALIINRKRIQNALSTDIAAVPNSDNEAAKVQSSDIDSDFYRRFAALVERELANSELSVEDLASELGLSRVQFYRKIKSLTNYSPAELLRIMRLKRADAMLKTTEKSISEILYSVGFSSPSYFTKCYREYFGETPTDVQRRTSKITGK